MCGKHAMTLCNIIKAGGLGCKVHTLHSTCVVHLRKAGFREGGILDGDAGETYMDKVLVMYIAVGLSYRYIQRCYAGWDRAWCQCWRS